MRILLDRNRCEGHGMCEDAAPQIFHLDDDGEVEHHFEGADLPDGLTTQAASAAGVCPVAALRLVKAGDTR